MAIANHTSEQPQTCPVCGKQYVARVPRRKTWAMQLQGLYRCGPVEGHTYLHNIEPDWDKLVALGTPDAGGEDA